MLWSKQQLTWAAALAVLLAACGWRPVANAQQVPPAPSPGGALAGQRDGTAQEGVETLTRGPVHEAFGVPAANDPEPTETVAAKPPEPIGEEAPEYKPEGAIWIPGYWDWDVAARKHIWVSGMWRVPPIGMRWVPSYWAQASGGWQRVPGFWIGAEAAAVDYQPTPPESLETGPSTPSPGANYFYVPGCWHYYDSGFRWRAGYWAPYRENYVWSPDRWYWTPGGYVFADGFWDWNPSARGQLFAPIAFKSGFYAQPGWRYRPWCVLDIAHLYAHLWIGPQAHCYYFGNYYGPGTSRWGFTPWCDWRYGNRGFYDPIWAWSNVYYGRSGVDYIDRISGWHRYYERNERERPAITFTEQRQRIAEGRIDRDRGMSILAADLREVAQRGDSSVRLSRLDDRERQSVRRVTEEIRQLNTERQRLEVNARVAVTDRTEAGATARTGERGGRGEGGRLRLPEPSLEVREAAKVDKSKRPPRPERPERGQGEDRTARSPDSRERPERPAATETQPTRPERPEQPTRPERPERPTRPERPELPAGPERPDQPTRPERPERPTRPEQPELPTAPDTSGPQAAPRTEPPRTEPPRTEPPRTEPPRTEVLRPELPSSEGPRTPGPRVDDPRKPSPRTEAPRTDAPRTAPRPETPRAKAPRTEAPRTEASRTEAPRAAPSTETPRASSPRTAPRSESPRVSTKPPSRSSGSPRSSSTERDKDDRE